MTIKLLPYKELKFKLIDSQEETLNRLKRRTELSESLVSRYTDKSFCGRIYKNEFKLISSAIGKGAFCVLTGTINETTGNVKVEIHKTFKTLLSIILILPIIGAIVTAFINPEELHPIMILVFFLQLLMIRFVFIGIAFRFLSKSSLNRLRDVADIDWIKN